MQETKPKLESSTAPPASTCLEPHWMEHDRTIFHSSSSANSPSDQGISCFLQFRHQQSTCHAPLNRGAKKRGNSRRLRDDETTWLHIPSRPSSAPWRHEGHEGLLTLPQGLHKGSLRCSKWPTLANVHLKVAKLRKFSKTSKHFWKTSSSKLLNSTTTCSYESTVPAASVRLTIRSEFTWSVSNARPVTAAICSIWSICSI